MQHYDVIIVGAGVGGATAAKFLTQAGKRAMVLEASPFPRWSATCSGIFGETFRILERRPEDYPGELLTQGMQDIRLFFGGRIYGSLPGGKVKSMFDETLYFTLRGELEAWIMGQSDAVVRPGTRVRARDITYTRDARPRYRVEVGGSVYTSDYLIGAGGTHCPVRRAFFPEPYVRSDLVVLREAEVHESRHGGLMLNYFYFDDLPGFAWLYPKGAGGRLTNIGVCAVGDRHEVSRINTAWQRFVAHLKSERLLDPDFDAAQAEGSSLYLHQAEGSVRANDDTCFIIGDAAAVAHRDFWNGITPSCLSGKLAASHIAGTAVYERKAIYPYLFRVGDRDSRLQRKLRDGLFRSALPALHRWLARSAAGGPVAHLELPQVGTESREHSAPRAEPTAQTQLE